MSDINNEDKIMPLLHVGVPVYNESKFIRIALQSVLDQSFRDFQLVVYDNCSTDDTCSIVEEMMETDDRIQLVRRDTNIGAVRNFELANKENRCKYVVWLSGHDMFAPEYFKQAVDWLELHDEFVMVYSQLSVVDYTGKVIGEEDDGYFVADKMDTSGMSLYMRLITVFQNCYTCMATHGIYRSTAHRNLIFEKVMAFDAILLFRIAEMGEYKCLDYIGFKARHVRVKESEIEYNERLLDYGVISNMDININKYARYAHRLLVHTSRIEGLSFFEQLKIYYLICTLVKRSQSVKYYEIATCFLTNK